MNQLGQMLTIQWKSRTLASNQHHNGRIWVIRRTICVDSGVWTSVIQICANMNPNSCWIWMQTYPEIVSLFISCIMNIRWMLFQPEYDKSMLLFWGGKRIQASTLGSSPCSKNIGDGPIKCLIIFLKKTEGTPLTN